MLETNVEGKRDATRSRHDSQKAIKHVHMVWWHRRRGWLCAMRPINSGRKSLFRKYTVHILLYSVVLCKREGVEAKEATTGKMCEI